MSGTPPPPPEHAPQHQPGPPPTPGAGAKPKRKGPPLVVKILAGVVGFVVLVALALGGWILFRPLNKADYSQAAYEAEEAGRVWELLEVTAQDIMAKPGEDEAKLDSQVEVLTGKIDEFDTELSDIENARVMGKDDEATALYETTRVTGDEYVGWSRDLAATVKPLALMQVACDAMDSNVYFQFVETDTLDDFDAAVADCQEAAETAVEAPISGQAQARVDYLAALRAELERFLAEAEKGNPSEAESQRNVLQIQADFTEADKVAAAELSEGTKTQSDQMVEDLGALFTYLKGKSQ